MPGDLITLPLRLTARAASLGLRVTEGVIGRALNLVGRGATEEASSQTASPARTREPEDARAERVDGGPRSEPSPAEPRPETAASDADEPPPPTPEPTHVSEEPVIVEERADPGAEEGAGAEVRIEEPWDGYTQLNATDVIARLEEADAAELAAVNLYESANQSRQTVLEAVERQIALISRGGSPE